MDDTLGTIRSSRDPVMQEEVSYLIGRDPSILAYGQQRFISKESKKNLYSLYEEEESGDVLIPDPSAVKTIKVFLRMKPLTISNKLSEQEKEAFSIINSTTLLTKLPTVEQNSCCLKRARGSDNVCKKYIFTQTFGPEITQYELFEQAVQPYMIEFLAGKNGTVMTYGTTNSGKSYTIQGTVSSPGIIPRALEFIFSNINPQVTPSYKPINHSDVVALDNQSIISELEMKTNLLTFGSVDKNQYIGAYKQMQTLLCDECPVKIVETSDDTFYSVWISFAEIYNETIFDLLSNDIQTRRPALKLSADSQGRTYIKGLKTVCVSSGSEAYQVLMAGQYNLKVAATALNAKSSRSHCIFTVKLIKHYRENNSEEIEVSTFSFCDLAGSERLKKTLNEGDRLKEAQNINTSLLVLGRCLKSIYETQGSKQKQNHIGPFRESKLTRLFQKALSGSEAIVMIVNVNPIPNLYVETQNVLNFSAIAKKIVIVPKKSPRKRSNSRFSKLVTHSYKTVTDWDTMEFENIGELDSEDEPEEEMVYREDYDEVVIDNERLKQEILKLKNSALERDLQIRKELADTYIQMIKKIENDWRNRFKDVEEQQDDHLEYSLNRLEAFYKEKINRINSRKRLHTDYDDSKEEDLMDREELENEVAFLSSKVKSLKETIITLREQKDNEIVERSKVSFELSLVKEELKSVNSLMESINKDLLKGEKNNYVDELKKQLKSEQDKNKQLKVFLNEAKEDYIAITTDCRNFEKKLKNKELLIVEYEDKVVEVEDQLESVNVCLSEKIRIIECLEDTIENQKKLITELKGNVADLKEKQRLKNDIIYNDRKREMEEKLRISQDVQTDVIEFENTSCQTAQTIVINCEIQTDEPEIEGEKCTYSMDRSLQTSLIDESQLSLIKEFNDLKNRYTELEIESSNKNKELEDKVLLLEDTITTLKKNHETDKNDFNNMLAIIKNKNEFQSEFLEDYVKKIKKMEEDLKISADLRKEMNETLKICKYEKEELESKLDEMEKKCRSLENQLEKTMKDRDIEIKSLQKEVKELIHAKNEYEESKDRENEKQIKATLKTLTATEEALSKEKEKVRKAQKQNEQLEKDLKRCMEEIKNIEMLKQKDEQSKQEIQQLREKNRALLNDVQMKQIELDKFSKNNSETIKRYEDLASCLQEDVEMKKKEISRLQELFQKHLTPTPKKDLVESLKLQLEKAQDQIRILEANKKIEKPLCTQKVRKTRQKKDKENYENTTDDETIHSDCRRRSPRHLKTSPSTTNEGSIIELSSTESKKRNRRQQTLVPPDVQQPVSSERKRTTRKKKLFSQDDECFVDIEPSNDPPIPDPLPPGIRNLRARKK